MEPAHLARSYARRLALQALYQLQINPRPWQDTHNQFAQDPEADRVDRDYFKELLAAIVPSLAALDERMAKFGEIEPAALDPVEQLLLTLMTGMPVRPRP